MSWLIEGLGVIQRWAREVVPHIAAILFLYLLSTLFFYPSYYQKKGLQQADIQLYSGTVKQLDQEQVETPHVPLMWNSKLFSGMPIMPYGDMYGAWAMELIKPWVTGYPLKFQYPFQIFFVSLIWTYLLLIAYGVRPVFALIGAVAFTFTTYHLIGIAAGHNSRIRAISYIPMIWTGMHLAYQRKQILLGALVASIGISLQLYAWHVQITYYTIFLVASYAIAQLIIQVKQQQWRHYTQASVVLLFFAVIAASAHYSPLTALLEYSKHSIRGKRYLSIPPPNETDSKPLADSGLSPSYAFAYSNGIFEPMTLLIPSVYGGASVETLPMDSRMGKALSERGIPKPQIKQLLSQVPTYWGDQPYTSPYYAGAVVILLFVWALFLLPRKWTLWLMALSVFCIALTWGKHLAWFNDFIFTYLPGYNKFRSVTFAIILPILGICLLAFVALEKALATSISPRIALRALLYAAATIGGLLVVCWLVSFSLNYVGLIDERLIQSGYPDWLMEALYADRAHMFRRDIGRALFFAAATAGLTYFLLKKQLNAYLFSLLLFGLLCWDLFPIGLRYYDTKRLYKKHLPQKEFYGRKLTEADEWILQDTTSFRVHPLNNPFNETDVSYYHASIGGHHAAKLRRYDDLIQHHLGRETQALLRYYGRPEGERQRDRPATEVLNMLNAKYFKGGPRRENVIENPNACGPVWLVAELKGVGSADEEITELGQQATSKVALMDTTEFTTLRGRYDTSGVIRLVRQTAHHIYYEAEVPNTSVAVFSEIYHPSWRLYLNDKPHPLLRLNYLLRGMVLPKGSHVIRMELDVSAHMARLKIHKWTHRALVWMVVLSAIAFLVRHYLATRARLRAPN